MCSMYDNILFKAQCYISTVFINAQRIHQLFLLDTKGNLVNCVKVRSLSITLNAITNVACFISLVAEYINGTKLRFDNTCVVKALISLYIYIYIYIYINR